MEFLLLNVFGIISYLSFLDSTPVMALDREPIPGSEDTEMQMVKLIYCINLVLTIPVNVCLGRNEISSFILGVIQILNLKLKFLI